MPISWTSHLQGKCEVEGRWQLARPVTRNRGWGNFPSWPRSENDNDRAMHPGRNTILCHYRGVSVDFGNCSEIPVLAVVTDNYNDSFQVDCLKEGTRQILFMLLASAAQLPQKITVWFFPMVNRCWTRKNCVSNSSMDLVSGQIYWTFPRKIPPSPSRCSVWPRMSVCYVSLLRMVFTLREGEQTLSDRVKNISNRREKFESLLYPHRVKSKWNKIQIPKLSLPHWNRIINI